MNPNSKKRKAKDGLVQQRSIWSDAEFYNKKRKEGAFFAVEAEELHPESVVPNFLPDVEHRCEVSLPKVTIKVEGSRTTAKLFPTSINNLQEYRNEQISTENRNTIIKGCDENVFTIKASEYDNRVLTLNVLQGNHRGIPYRGTLEHRNKHHIKVSCWIPNGMKCTGKDCLIRMRNNIINLVDRSLTRFPTRNGRKGGVGQMFSYGHKTVTEKYASIRKRPGEKRDSVSYNNLQLMIGLTKAISMDMAENMCERHFAYSLSQIKLAERGRQLTDDHQTLSVNTPCPELGSHFGISCKFFSTINFANEFHYDPDDLSVTFAYWVERHPGTARNWFLVFPNMIVHKDGIQYKGLRIELCEGACVEWDGRIMNIAPQLANPELLKMERSMM
jgi:hypothetical protein